MKNGRAQGWMGSAGDDDPARSLEPPITVSRAAFRPRRGAECGICLVIQVVLSGLLKAADPDTCLPFGLENSIVFWFFFYLLSPWFHYPRMCVLLWTKRRPFSWVTASFPGVVIGHLLSLCGFDNCTEKEVHWPRGAPTLGNCESLTTFKVNLLTWLRIWWPESPHHVYPVAGRKVRMNPAFGYLSNHPKSQILVRQFTGLLLFFSYPALTGLTTNSAGPVLLTLT